MKIQSGDLYVSAVEGHVVARLGSGTAHSKEQQIGVYPVTATKKDGTVVWTGLRWDLDEVVFIPRAEYLAHLNAYDASLNEKALILRKKEDFDAWLVAQEKRSNDEAKKVAQEATTAPDEKAATAAQSNPTRSK